ncbi:Molecular chaperone Hsp31 and glyoxalase 3 [Nocardia farcinica]|uniref:type 1 glutamine amidotransferase domain-containing protein n=1 Tax=Nocardia farcinica TaxID=37329 RepID=UPI000BFA5FF0|nr:type 1 glutamine amidotransferase domain-containing protein [Nocardia farcinica]PFW98332.1 Molecular chaperone Hsp31 and glyoxalase 3 [Nocardia farcinica]PFW99809.1 Molecular chaperone Hsp31 and glyoxalase 3 [Nocardia farcinica]
MAEILFVMSGADHWTLADGTKHPTGFWAEEFVAPYEVFTAAGHTVTVATPGGVVPSVDRGSLAPEANGGPENAAKLAEAVRTAAPLQHPVPLAEVDPADYAVVFYPGGHGPMEDLPTDADSGRVLAQALSSGKPLGVVCHGPAALLATADADGNSPFAGYRLTAFSNAEEEQAGLAAKAPWLLADRLRELGVEYREGEPWAPHIEVDRTLYTGQNPASSRPLAEEIVRALD